MAWKRPVVSDAYDRLVLPRRGEALAREGHEQGGLGGARRVRRVRRRGAPECLAGARAVLDDGAHRDGTVREARVARKAADVGGRRHHCLRALHAVRGCRQRHGEGARVVDAEEARRPRVAVERALHDARRGRAGGARRAARGPHADVDKRVPELLRSHKGDAQPAAAQQQARVALSGPLQAAHHRGEPRGGHPGARAARERRLS